MRKNFNSVQTLKSSEDCYKFSKSVSYETLVGGTTTTGRGIKQTQRLSEGNADKPLSAVGTLTSLLCNSAKVVENLLQTLPVVRLVKIIILISVLSVGMVAESQADEVIPTSGTCNADGTCLWTLDSAGTLTISAKNGAKDVEMADYNCDGNPCGTSSLVARPWEVNLQQIKNVVIGDNITYIGDDAFQAAHNLQIVTGMKDVTTIGSNGVFAVTGLTSITIPEGVTSIGSFAFSNAGSLTSITIPDNINTANWKNSVFAGLPASTNIVCQGGLNTCYEKLARYFTSETCPQSLKDVGKGNLCNCSSVYCIDSNRVSEATKEQCTGNYGWSGAGCSRKNTDGSVDCASGYAEYKNKCWDELPFAKKRWTPAEANQWLHDGNDNFVVITFKK